MTVRLQHGGRVVNGVGADPDIVVASAKAYLAALNKLHSKLSEWRHKAEAVCDSLQDAFPSSVSL